MTSPLRHWLGQGELSLVELQPRPGYGGSRIGGVVQAPHQPLGPVPAMVPDPPKWTLPCAVVSGGKFADDDWVDDPGIRWFAKAETADSVAVRLLDHVVCAAGQAGLVLTDRRVAVVTASKLLAANKPAEPAERGGLVGKAFSAMGDWLSNETEWTMGDEVASLWEVSSARLRDLSAPWVGRSIPPPELIQLTFDDGSVLLIHEAGSRAKVSAVRHGTR